MEGIGRRTRGVFALLLFLLSMALVPSKALELERKGGAPTTGGRCPRRREEEELKEFSVVYTDRALNSMSPTFVKVMADLDAILRETYNAERAVILPGSGSFGMEAIARQVATDKPVLVIRNGYFSYRWTDIFDQSNIPESSNVLMATTSGGENQYMPRSIDEVVKEIHLTRPSVIFAPHVETSTGIVLSDEYVRAVGLAAREVEALFVLDGVAAGMQWIDMKENLVDFYVTAPQKGWSGIACAGIVMMGKRGYDAVSVSTSTSMVLNLKKWLGVMETYVSGGFSYYTTMPTDCLRFFRDAALEIKEFGFDKAKKEFIALGKAVRAMMKGRGYKSVAAPGFEAPGVAVFYTDDPLMVSKLKKVGLQTAAGVPFMLNEEAGLTTFRIGLFGMDKVYNTTKTVATLEEAFARVEEERRDEL